MGGPILDQLRGYEENDDENDESGVDIGGSDPRPDQGSATGGAEGVEVTHVAEVRAAPGSCQQSETARQGTFSILNEESQKNETVNNKNLGAVENLMPFPASINRLNNHARPCANHCLSPFFLCGKRGGTTCCDRDSEVNMTDSSKHILKHCARDDCKNEHARPLAEHSRWPCLVQRTSERHGSNGQRSTFFKKNCRWKSSRRITQNRN